MEHDIRFNYKKSAVIIFRNYFVKDFNYPSFVMNGESIKEVPFVKYLGNVISADMKDDLDIMRQCRQLYAQGNALARRFHMCSGTVKVTIFRSYCSSLYTSQLLWKYKVNSIRKLYVAYNNAFRMLFMLPRDCSASGMFAVGETGYGCHTFYITDVFRNIVIIADIRLMLCLNIVSCAHINMQFVIFTS